MLPELVSRTPTLTARLNTATAALQDLGLFAGRMSWLDYRLHLILLYGFHASVEAALSAYRPLTAVIADARLRNHKTALLAHDLVALGVERRDLAQVPRMRFPAPLALPEALGWTYAVESTTLRGKLVARRLARHLPEEIQRASAYLGCYGDEAQTRWRELGDALDAFGLDRSPAVGARARGEPAAQSPDLAALPDDLACADRACARVIDAARGGLVQLRRWLGPVLQARTSQRHA